MTLKRRDRVRETEYMKENQAKNYVTQFQQVDNGSNHQEDLLFRGHFDGFSTLLQYFLCRRTSRVAQNKLTPSLLQLISPSDKQDALAECKLTYALFPQLIGAFLAMICLLSLSSFLLKSDKCFVSRGGTTSV